MVELLELEQLAMVSECGARILLPLLSTALNIQHIKTGIHCQVRQSGESHSVSETVRRESLSQ